MWRLLCPCRQNCLPTLQLPPDAPGRLLRELRGALEPGGLRVFGGLPRDGVLQGVRLDAVAAALGTRLVAGQRDLLDASAAEVGVGCPSNRFLHKRFIGRHVHDRIVVGSLPATCLLCTTQQQVPHRHDMPDSVRQDPPDLCQHIKHVNADSWQYDLAVTLFVNRWWWGPAASRICWRRWRLRRGGRWWSRPPPAPTSCWASARRRRVAGFRGLNPRQPAAGSCSRTVVAALGRLMSSALQMHGETVAPRRPLYSMCCTPHHLTLRRRLAAGRTLPACW
jgi:hypothetical protein